MIFKLKIAVLTFLAAVLAGNLSARPFLWNYSAAITDKGEFEMEYYNTYKSATSIFSQQVEVAYGVSDKFDLGIYQMLNNLTYAGTKVKVRYMLPKLLTLSNVAYFEITNLDEYEAKWILSKDYRKFVFAENYTIEYETYQKRLRYKEFKAGFSFAYKVSDDFFIGIETDEKYFGPYFKAKVLGTDLLGGAMYDFSKKEYKARVIVEVEL